MRSSWLALAATVAALAMGSLGATICPDTNEPAPEVVTLVASTTNPATDAWVVSPNCSVMTVSLAPDANGDPVLAVGGLGIEQVVSVPTDTAEVITRGNPFSRGANYSMATKIRVMEISSFPPDWSKLLLPPGLNTLFFPQLTETKMTSLDGIVLPSKLQNIVIELDQVTSLKNVQLPASLVAMSIVHSPLKLIDLSLPSGLQFLSFISMTTAAFTTLERLQIPSGLVSLRVAYCDRATIRGVKWPPTLNTFDFSGTNIDVLEIRQSDLATFQNLTLFEAKVSQTFCRGSGKLEVVKGVNVCVISDSDFDLLYSIPVTIGPVPPVPSSVPTKSPPTPTSTSRGSLGGTADSAISPDPSSGEETDRPSRPTPTKKTTSKPDTSVVADDTSNETSPADVSDATPSSIKSSRSPTVASPKSSSNSSSSAITGTRNAPTLAASSTQSPEATPIVNTTNATTSSKSIVIIVLACALTFVVGGFVFRVVVKKQQHQKQDSKLVDDSTIDTYTSADTPTFTPTEPTVLEPMVATFHALRVAFMTDQDLVRCRIDQIQLGSKIAEGSTGAVYQGSHRGRAVAVKQLPSQAWTNSSMVAKFLDEMRSCARLDHPKIVEFIGLTWSGGRDLAAVSEFMAGGDLKTVLYNHPSSTGSEWATPWTEKKLRSKTLIALDVGEAVVYLHSFETPILHRNLTAKNVLLDTEGNAKISEIGIGREISIDTTLTSGVGTAAWIAPEVLRGERYTVKADIYSLGVLLVEMDRCSHPYASEPLLMTESSSSSATSGETQATVAHKNTQIAVLVSTGEVRPSPTPQCPDDVKQVVARCLSDEASDRPMAMEVVYQLRQVRKAQESVRGTS